MKHRAMCRWGIGIYNGDTVRNFNLLFVLFRRGWVTLHVKILFAAGAVEIIIVLYYVNSL